MAPPSARSAACRATTCTTPCMKDLLQPAPIRAQECELKHIFQAQRPVACRDIDLGSGDRPRATLENVLFASPKFQQVLRGRGVHAQEAVSPLGQTEAREGFIGLRSMHSQVCFIGSLFLMLESMLFGSHACMPQLHMRLGAR